MAASTSAGTSCPPSISFTYAISLALSGPEGSGRTGPSSSSDHSPSYAQHISARPLTSHDKTRERTPSSLSASLSAWTSSSPTPP